jgi:hypothetical protein
MVIPKHKSQLLSMLMNVGSQRTCENLLKQMKNENSNESKLVLLKSVLNDIVPILDHHYKFEFVEELLRASTNDSQSALEFYLKAYPLYKHKIYWVDFYEKIFREHIKPLENPWAHSDIQEFVYNICTDCCSFSFGIKLLLLIIPLDYAGSPDTTSDMFQQRATTLSASEAVSSCIIALLQAKLRKTNIDCTLSCSALSKIFWLWKYVPSISGFEKIIARSLQKCGKLDIFVDLTKNVFAQLLSQTLFHSWKKILKSPLRTLGRFTASCHLRLKQKIQNSY